MLREGLIGSRKEKWGGRNMTGRVTVRGRGGEHKRRVRIIDHERMQGRGGVAIVERIMYNPSTTGKIAVMAMWTSEGVRRWNILAPEQLRINAKVRGPNVKGQSRTMPEIGEVRPLKEMRIGKYVYNIQGKYARGAGGRGKVQKMWYDEEGQMWCEVVLPSKKRKIFTGETLACVGQVSNAKHRFEVYGKAGARRRIGRRPKVRGEARNPIDHPHGGKSHGSGGKGNPARNVWGKLAKWVPTQGKKVAPQIKKKKNKAEIKRKNNI